MDNDMSSTIEIIKEPPELESVRQDNDTPWKNMLHMYFEDCMVFFFPILGEAIDWSIPVRFRDGELQKMTVDGDTGRRIVDVLAEVSLKNGEQKAILLHLEIQGSAAEHFPERIFIYYTRIFDRYRLPVVTLAILTDEDPNWRPNVYELNNFGFKLHMTFPLAKLRDYKDQQEALEQSENPFALVVLAHLASMSSKKDIVAGLEAKVALTRHLYRLAKKRDKAKEFVRTIFNVIDFLLALPGTHALEYERQLHHIEQEIHMPYISSIEQLAQQQGIAQGMAQGLCQGLKQAQQNIALNLLQAGIEIIKVAQFTGMTPEELRTMLIQNTA